MLIPQSTRVCLVLIGALVACTQLAVAQHWTQFEMNCGGDTDGRFLWTTAENWTQGLPGRELSAEIGDDHSGRALHCVIPAGSLAECNHLELAEHARTQGTTLRLEKGASLTVSGSAVLSKDRESWCYVDGALHCLSKGAGLRVGGPWGRPQSNEPASCHLMIGPTGIVDAWFVGINTSHRSRDAPSSPWGPQFYARSTDSEIVVDGGTLIARQGLRISTTEARRPGKLSLRGGATFTTDREGEYGVEIWCGVWEINGGEIQIQVGDIEFWGNKFQDAINAKTQTVVGAGVAVLKLTGNGVSRIHAREVRFVDAAVLDVSELKVPPGTYCVIDGDSIGQTNLRLAQEGSEAGTWRIEFDRASGDVLVVLRAGHRNQRKQLPLGETASARLGRDDPGSSWPVKRNR
jgi:hypothetical protein